jgi:hypothetical protein
MATTNNGWPKDPVVVRLYVGQDYDGCEVALGDVATLFADFMTRFHNEVEPLRKANGYRSSAYNASIPGSVASSNHVSGTAVDLNGDVHPNEAAHGGAIMASGFSPSAYVALNRLLGVYGGIIVWGGNTSAKFPRGARDYMHFEINATAAQLREFCKRYDAPVTPPAGPPPVIIDSNTKDSDMVDDIIWLYKSLLGRGVPQDDILARLGQTPAEIANELLKVVPANEPFSVDAAYQEYLGRAPDPEGKANWLKQPTVKALRDGLRAAAQGGAR